MRVLYYTSLFPSPLDPGLAPWSFQWARALQSAGCEVTVVAPIGLTPPKKVAIQPRATARWLAERLSLAPVHESGDIRVEHPKWAWPPKMFFGGLEPELASILLRRRFDAAVARARPTAVVGSWLPDAAAAAALAERHGLPTIAVAHGSDVNVLPAEYPWWSRMAAKLAHRTAAAVYVSESLRKRGASVGLNQVPSHVIPNGVDPDRFDLGPERPRGTTILSVGNLTEVKGHRFLLEALSLLRHEHGVKASVRIVGAGALHDDLVHTAETLRITGAVDLVGPLHGQALVEAYQEADVFCLASRAEGFASVILEAMATGLPVVATDVGGASEVVTPTSGVVVPPCDAPALAVALAMTMSRNWDRRAIRAAVVPQFTWAKAGRTFARLLEEVAASGSQKVAAVER